MLTSSQVGALGTSQVPALGTSQVPAVGTSQVGALGTSQVGALGTSQVPAVGTSQVGALGTSPTGMLGSLGTTQIGSLGLSQVDALKNANIGTKLGSSDLGITLDSLGKPVVKTADITTTMISDALKNTPTNIEYNPDGTPKIVKPIYTTVDQNDLSQITADKVTTPIVDRTGTQSAADIAKLVDDAKSADVNVTPDSLVSNRLSGLLSKNNPYIQQAVNAANLQASRRGMLNTGAAAGFAQDAAIKAALPIAQADAATVAKANEANAAAKNALINAGLDLKSKGLISDTGNNVTLNTTQAKLTLDASQYDATNKLNADTFNATALNKLLTDNNAILNASEKDGFDTWAKMAEADTLSQSNTYQIMLQGQLDALKQGATDANALNLALANGNINLALAMKDAIAKAVAADVKVTTDAATAAQLAYTNAAAATALADRATATAANAAKVAADAAKVQADVNATAAEKEVAAKAKTAAELEASVARQAINDAKIAEKATADEVKAKADAAKALADRADTAAANAAKVAADAAKVQADVNASVAEKQAANAAETAANLAYTNAKAEATKAKEAEDATALKVKTDKEAADAVTKANAEAAKALAEEGRVTKILEGTITKGLEQLRADNSMVVESYKTNATLYRDAVGLMNDADKDIAEFTRSVFLTPDITADAQAKKINTYTASRQDLLKNTLASAKTMYDLDTSDAAKTSTALLTPK